MNLIQTAITQIDYEESPRGSNWGPVVKKYLNSVGINSGAPWCMAFVYWCAKEAAVNEGVSNPLVKTGGVLKGWRNIDEKYKVKTPQAGDIFIMDFGKGLGHTGIIEKVTGTTLYTIEGNTNNDGSREGYAVERKTRKSTDKKIIGYIRTGL